MFCWVTSFTPFDFTGYKLWLESVFSTAPCKWRLFIRSSGGTTYTWTDASPVRSESQRYTPVSRGVTLLTSKWLRCWIYRVGGWVCFKAGPSLKIDDLEATESSRCSVSLMCSVTFEDQNDETFKSFQIYDDILCMLDSNDIQYRNITFASTLSLYSIILSSLYHNMNWGSTGPVSTTQSRFNWPPVPTWTTGSLGNIHTCPVTTFTLTIWLLGFGSVFIWHSYRPASRCWIFRICKAHVLASSPELLCNTWYRMSLGR